ncbi:MAG: CRISPR-associated endonuclease Cas1 [Methanoregulaceae archaeon]|nr:CRISPR-associated endonuclease Cas1 [Methanoregulaceae archaeon]
MDVPWLVVAGFGAHIKSTRNTLFVQKEGVIEEYPLESVRHLVVIGGHTLHTPVIANLIKKGARLSFFEPDGKPIGTIRPFNNPEEVKFSEIQKTIPNYQYAVSIARSSMRSKTLLIGRLGETAGHNLFYEGELDIFSNALDELEYLVKISEIRRIERLTTDMYYEVISRVLPPELGFRRRTSRPYHDPVNAIFAFGYAMLFGNVMYSVTGASLDPDIGMLNRGQSSLIYDIMEPFKTDMIDREAIRFIKEDLHEQDYECSHARCILSDPCMRALIRLFHTTINQDVIDRQVAAFRQSLEQKTDYIIER